MAQLSASVGKGGRNVPGDVSRVQKLINQSIRLLDPYRYLEANGICDAQMIDMITEFQRRVMKVKAPDGRVDTNGRTLAALTTTASGQPYNPTPAPAATNGGKYTDNPNELVTKVTTPSSRDVVAALRAAWPELTEVGAHTLTAQFLFETGGGKSCFNWNLGNVKAVSSAVPHMYLKNTTEGCKAANADAIAAAANGLCRVATAEEIKKKGWPVPPAGAILVYQPPHPASRFRAYPSFAEGGAGWIKHHQGCASRYTTYLATVNAGDCGGVARILKQDRYYTGSEAAYGHGMQHWKAQVDRSLGTA